MAARHPHSRQFGFLHYAVLVALVFAAPAHAQIHWVGYQNGCDPTGPLSASFFDPSNWEGFLVPDSLTDARFGSGFDPGATGYPRLLHFGDYCVRIGGACGTPIFNPGVGVCRNLSIADDAFEFDLGPGGYQCTPIGSEVGGLRVRDQFALGIVRDVGGLSGHASLVVRNGQVRALGQTLIGFDNRGINIAGGGSGALTLDGPNTSFVSGQLLDVGVDEPGDLQILNGAKVTASEVRVAQQWGANGTVHVNGSGSRLDAGTATVGGWQLNTVLPTHGHLTVDGGAGAAFTALLLCNSNNPNTTGEVVATGAGTSLVVTPANIEVGLRAGTGDFVLGEGASCSVPALRLGVLAGAVGQGLLRGAGTQASMVSLVVGREGSGHCVMETGASLTNSDTLFVASRTGSQGDLTLRSGAQAACLDAIVGRLPNLGAHLILSDVGTTLHASRRVRAGLAPNSSAEIVVGTGALLAADSGVVISPGSRLELHGTIQGAVDNQGAMFVFNPSTVQGALVLGAAGRLVADLRPSAPALVGDPRRAQAAGVTVAGKVTLGGTLELILPQNTDPTPAITYELLQADSVVGAFADVVAPAGVVVSTQGGVLRVQVPPVLGTGAPRPMAAGFQLRALDRGQVEYQVPATGAPFALEVFDAAGRLQRRLWDGTRAAGVYRERLAGSGAGLPSGVYYVRLRSADTHLSRPVIVTR